MKDLSLSLSLSPPLAFNDFVQLGSRNEVDSFIDTIEIGPAVQLIFIVKKTLTQLLQGSAPKPIISKQGAVYYII